MHCHSEAFVSCWLLTISFSKTFETLYRGPPLGSSQKKATLSAKCCVTASCTTQTYSAEAEVTAKKEAMLQMAFSSAEGITLRIYRLWL